MYHPIRRTVTTALALTLSAAASAQAPGAAPSQAARGGHFQQMLHKLDSNGDGRISLAEYVAGAATKFRAIDAGHHGSVDAADIAGSPDAIARLDRRAGRLVQRLDTAGNGYVTQDEFVAAAQKRFDRLDRNGDGKLTPDELSVPRHGRRGRGRMAAAAMVRRGFDKLDANHDGVVTADEFVAAARTKYSTLDAGHDGKVTAQELATSAKATRRAIRFANRLVARLDTNGDGRVTQDEFVAAAKARFARLDTNGDGYIDAGEATARLATRRGRRGPG